MQDRSVSQTKTCLLCQSHQSKQITFYAFVEDTRRVNLDGGQKEENRKCESIDTTPKEQEREVCEATTTPSVIECKINRKSYCLTYLDQADKGSRTSKVWKHRGGGRGFGYVTRKVSKYVRRKRVIPQCSEVPVERGSVTNNII